MTVLASQPFEVWPLAFPWAEESAEEDATEQLHGRRSAKIAGPFEFVTWSGGTVADTPYFTRGAYRLTALPGENAAIGQWFSNVNGVLLTLFVTESGEVVLWNERLGATVIETGFEPPVGVWFYIEVMVLIPATGEGTVAMRIRDESGAVLHESAEVATDTGNVSINVVGWGSGASSPANIDDLAVGLNEWIGPVVIAEPATVINLRVDGEWVPANSTMLAI